MTTLLADPRLRWLTTIVALVGTSLFLAGINRPNTPPFPHNQGKDCFACHANLKLGGIVFADTAGQIGQPGVSISLISPTGDVIVLEKTDSSGNIVAHFAADGIYQIKVGDITSRTWHSIPQQGSCNTCHVPGGNRSDVRTKSFPTYHTALPSDNACTHCHHFPASMSFAQLATTGVLSTFRSPLPDPGSQVQIGGQAYAFDASQYSIVTVRPDVFAAGYFSMFDVILAVAQKNHIPIEYYYDESRKTHFITKLNNVSADFWYRFSYDAGSGNSQKLQNRRANRWDEALWRPGVWIRVTTGEDLESIKREYLEEIDREKAQGHIVPTVSFAINPSRYKENPDGAGRITVSRQFSNVSVTPHQWRSTGFASPHSKPFQPDVVTSLDILLSLRDQGKLDVVTGVFYSCFAQHYIDSYYIVELGFPGLGTAHASGRQGFVYTSENGSYSSLPNGADAKLHMTSDINVIHAPDFSYWRWAELGNPYYESSEPTVTSIFEESVLEDFEAMSRGFNLHAPYPNPFNGKLNVSFNIFEPGRIKLAVFNTVGQEIAALSSGRIDNIGIHKTAWDPLNLPSGTYYLVMSYEGHSQVRKVIYLK